MPCADALGYLLDLGPLRDVATLRLGPELERGLLQPLDAAAEEDAPPAGGREPPRKGEADAARASGDYRDANVRRVERLISTVSSIGSA